MMQGFLREARGGGMEEDDVDWAKCGKDGCGGIRLGRGGKCLRHAEEQDLDAELKRFGEDGHIDARGVPITKELLQRLLAAAPKTDHGQPVLTNPRFDEATFTGKATFKGGPGFYGTVFKGTASFGGATFEGTASFGGATFEGDAGFYGAIFEGTAAFHRVTFKGEAWFDRATFKGEARFVEACFRRDADFDRAIFHGDAWFNRARVNGNAYFLGATFQHARQLGPMLVRKSLVLDGAIFHKRAQIQVGAAALCCRGTRFLAGVQLQVRWAQVVLDDADLAAPSMLTGVPSPFPDLDEGRWGQAAKRLLPEPQVEPQWHWQPRLVSLRRTDVAGLTLTHIDLRACQFTDAQNLDRLHIATIRAFAHTPGGWRWTARRALAEEHHWRHRQAVSRRADDRSSGGISRSHARQHHDRTWWPPACRQPSWATPAQPLGPAQVADLYRALRKGREDTKDEPGAADFYYGEMEMRRHAKRFEAKGELQHGHFGPWAAAITECAVLWLYWLVSGYGLRAWRALAALAVVIGLVGVGFSRAGFHHPHPSQVVSWLYALQATVSLEGKARQLSGQLTLPGELLRVGLRFTGPVLLGLAVLSVRGRVKR
jgi:uncharacterized protein YjbI with pentapeptide repeats